MKARIKSVPYSEHFAVDFVGDTSGPLQGLDPTVELRILQGKNEDNTAAIALFDPRPRISSTPTAIAKRISKALAAASCGPFGSSTMTTEPFCHSSMATSG